MTSGLDAVAQALAGRLANVDAAIDRLDAFSPATADEGSPDASAARETVLRALRTVGDAANMAILATLHEGDATTARVASMVAMARPAAWERIGDLVQVGLVARGLEGDRVGLTRAGEQVIAWIDEMVDAIDALRKSSPSGSP